MISQHLRSNVVGYMALFVALSGTAVALPGSNTVTSDDIKAQNVKRSDLATNSVTSAKVKAAAITSGDLATLTGLAFAPSTTPAGGIDFGGDLQLYRANSAQLRLDGAGLRIPDSSVFVGPNNQGTSISTQIQLDNPTTGVIRMREQTGNVVTGNNYVVLYVRESGGLTQLVAEFADGNVDILAAEAP